MISTIRLRKWIGWLSFLLPWIVSLLLWKIPESISITYYTYRAGPVFMIVLGAASILLVSYCGYDSRDDILNTIAGFCGIGICLFPCWNGAETIVGTFQLTMPISNIFHTVFAAIFFLILAINSLWLFTKSSGEMTRNKKIRNIIFQVCGIGMVASFLIFALPYFYIKIWLAETLALTFFGISWLTKANCYPWLFADPRGE